MLGDDYQLEQVFVNIFLNALEAINGEGTVSVSSALVSADAKVGMAGPQVCVVVQDNGGGISPEDLERLFEPFFTTKSSGTGLGLAMARRVLAEHGGQVEIESQLAQGTTVRLLVPVAQADSGSDDPG